MNARLDDPRDAELGSVECKPLCSVCHSPGVTRDSAPWCETCFRDGSSFSSDDPADYYDPFEWEGE